MTIDDLHYQAFVAASHQAAQYGLVTCSSGNLSWRLTEDRVMLSASGSWLAELTPEQIALVDLTSGRSLNDVKPTCEIAFHLGILKARPDVDVVLHFQTPYATALACGQPESVDFNVIIEIPVYLKRIAIVEYLPPGSPELAQAVVQALSDEKTHLAMLKNHGLVTVGTTFNDAIQKAAFFELACRICLTNPDVTPIDPEAVSQLKGFGKA